MISAVDILQQQKQLLLQDNASLNQSIQQKSLALDQLVKEIEQAKGMISYNQMLINRTNEAIAALQPPATS